MARHGMHLHRHFLLLLAPLKPVVSARRAARWGHAALLRTLARHGADLGAVSATAEPAGHSGKDQALQAAAREWPPGTAAAAAHGAVSEVPLPCAISIRLPCAPAGVAAGSPLQEAVRWGRQECVELLREWMSAG
jgi:hypothetical protein